MAVPQFDSNTWYSLLNKGGNAYLACSGISICGADASDLATFEFFQVASAGNDSVPYYIRPQSRKVDDQGQPFCINLAPGQPSLALCNNASAVWGTGYWNGANADDGLFLYNTQLGDTQRLFLSDNGTWSLPDYNSASSGDQDRMRWSAVSRAAINDGSYSTVPAAIPSGTVVPTITSASSSQTGVSNSSGASVVRVTVSSSSSTMSSSPSTSSSLASSESSAEQPLTTTVVETPPVVTASATSSSARTSTTPTPSPTLVSRAGRTGVTTYTFALVAAGLALPQIILASL